jgi:hypothetical protein
MPAKAARLLCTGAVCIVHADGRTVSAIVQGDTGTWDVDCDGERWACSCPARKGCAHLLAVELVATKAVAA